MADHNATDPSGSESKIQPREPDQPVHSQREAQAHSVEVAEYISATATRFSGPIPPPAILRGYEDVFSGAAKRIVAMAEAQATHRQNLESRNIVADIWRSYLGIGSAFLLCLSALGGGTFLVYNGHDTAGVMIATSGVIGLASTFIYGTITRRNERKEKAEILANSKPTDAHVAPVPPGPLAPPAPPPSLPPTRALALHGPVIDQGANLE